MDNFTLKQCLSTKTCWPGWGSRLAQQTQLHGQISGSWHHDTRTLGWSSFHVIAKLIFVAFNRSASCRQFKPAWLTKSGPLKTKENYPKWWPLLGQSLPNCKFPWKKKVLLGMWKLVCMSKNINNFFLNKSIFSTKSWPALRRVLYQIFFYHQ